jgi:hypothetical protein
VVEPVVEPDVTEQPVETSSAEMENTEGAVGDEIGNGVETDDEDGITEDDIDTAPHVRIEPKTGYVSDTVRIMEEIMGDATN